MPQLCFLAGLYIVFLVWVSQCLHHHQSQALYFLQGTCSHSVSFHPYPSTYRHRSDTERLQNAAVLPAQCVSFPALPSPHHTWAPQSLLNTFHVLQEEEARRDEEMRHRAMKVKSFHLLLVPSLRHFNLFL